MERLAALVNDKWCRHGRIVHPTHPSGVFLSVEEFMMCGRALIEHPVPLGQHRNYQSFYEAQQEAEDDLDPVISGKFAK